jgi:hypothetical protein
VATKRAKKKRRRQARATDPNLARQERLEARRQAKAEAEARQRRAEFRAKWIRRGILLVIIVGLTWFFFLRTQRPTEIAGHELDLFSESQGSPPHVDTPVAYPMTPPVSGQHAPTPMGCGTHAEQPPNETMVHALEHGAIGLLFDPERAAEEDIRELEAIVADSDSHVFSAPYSGMETTFSIISWGEMMRLDELDAPAIDEYIDTFIEGGPESVDCPKDQDATFEPEPSPSPSPQDEGGNDRGNNDRGTNDRGDNDRGDND